VDLTTCFVENGGSMSESGEFNELFKKLKTEVDVNPGARYSGEAAGPLTSSYPQSAGLSVKQHGGFAFGANMSGSDKNIQRRTMREDLVQRKISLGLSDDKEIVLLGILSSIIVIIIGALASMGYLIAVGSAGFIISILVMARAVFYYVYEVKKTGSGGGGKELAERINSLENRMVSLKSSSSGRDISGERSRELEEKIEELRSIVKSLTKASE